MSTHTPSEPSLLDRLGGTSALESLLGAFYFRVLADPSLAVFFRAVPMDRLLNHQRHFLSAALQPDHDLEQLATTLREAHAPLVTQLGLSDSHFDALLRALEAAMRDLGQPEALTQALTHTFEGFREAVLGGYVASSDAVDTQGPDNF